MYMPLCRKCHMEQTDLNKDNVFVGDPTDLSKDVKKAVQAVEKSAKAKELKTPSTAEHSLSYQNSKENNSSGKPETVFREKTNLVSKFNPIDDVQLRTKEARHGENQSV